MAASITLILLPSQTGKRRLPAMSMARPEGDSQPAGQVCGDLVCVGVDLEYLALVFNVVVDVPLAVGDGELGLAGYGDGGDDFAARRRR